MKKNISAFVVIFLVTTVINSVIAQNPKTNAEKVNKGYQAPAIPTPPLQRPVQNDSVIVPINQQQNSQQTSSSNPISKNG